jgi:hypothetical protein
MKNDSCCFLNRSAVKDRSKTRTNGREAGPYGSGNCRCRAAGAARSRAPDARNSFKLVRVIFLPAIESPGVRLQADAAIAAFMRENFADFAGRPVRFALLMTEPGSPHVACFTNTGREMLGEMCVAMGQNLAEYCEPGCEEAEPESKDSPTSASITVVSP